MKLNYSMVATFYISSNTPNSNRTKLTSSPEHRINQYKQSILWRQRTQSVNSVIFHYDRISFANRKWKWMIWWHFSCHICFYYLRDNELVNSVIAFCSFQKYIWISGKMCTCFDSWCSVILYRTQFKSFDNGILQHLHFQR